VLRPILSTLVVLVLSSQTAVAQKKSVREMAPSRVSTTSAPLAKKECERFAMAFEEAIRTRDWKSAESEIDWMALYTKATNGIPAPDKTRASFRDTADTYFRGSGGIVSGLAQTVASGGTFRFLRIVDSGSSTRVVFRMTYQPGDVPDYVSLVLEPESDGSAVATDIENASEGDLASVRLRRYFLGLSAGATRMLEDKVQGVDKARVHWQKELESADEAFRDGQNKKALEILEALPDDIKGDHAVVLARLNAARAMSGDAFKAVLARVRTNSKNDIAVERLALDYFLEKKEFAEARRSVLALNETVGGDAYLDWMTAVIEDEAGEGDAAIAACRRSIARDDTLQDPWWTMLSIHLRESRYSETLSVLEGMQSRFEIDWRVIEHAPEYQSFHASEFGKAWKTRVATKK